LAVGVWNICKTFPFESLLHQSPILEGYVMGESFRELLVWQRAMEMTVAVYRYTEEFPAAERFGLISQLRRPSVSVRSNIAEGYGRGTRGEYLQFLGHARGSISEVETQLEIAAMLGFGTEGPRSQAGDLCNEVQRMLVALHKKLKG
jgi:four helix bundle protein